MPGVLECSAEVRAELKGFRRRIKAWFRRDARLRLVSIDVGEFARAGFYLIVHVRERRSRHLRACFGEQGLEAKWLRFLAGPRWTNFLFGYSRPDEKFVVQMVGRNDSTQLFLKDQIESALEALRRRIDDSAE